MAKRFVIASAFFSSPAMIYAVEETPRLHVAEQQLMLLEPTNGKPVVAAKTPAAVPPPAEPRVARLPDQPVELPSRHVDDGWVAREHINQRVPLRDPLALTPQQTPAASESATNKSAAKQSPPGQAAGGDALTLDPLGGPQAGSARTARQPAMAQPATEQDLTPQRELSPALEGLTPVPLMRPLLSQDEPAPRATPAVEVPAVEAPAVEWELEDLAPARERAIPVRRPDLTREIDQERGLGSVESAPTQNEIHGEAVEDNSVEASSSAALEPTHREARATQLRDLFREPAAHNEGDAPGRAVESELEAADSQGYVGDWDEQDWQRDHNPPAAKATPKKTPLVITPAVQRMRGPMEAALLYHFQRPEKAPERSSWGMLHSMMVYGVETQVLAGRQRYNLVAWMAGNNICRGQRIFTVDHEGISPRSGVGLQGHQGQFLAVFGLIGVPESYPLYVGKRKFTVADLVAREQGNCRSGEELTFTLIGLSHYLDTDATWTASDGKPWDFERLIEEELDQQVIGAACGGTHRLMGLSHALRVRREQGRPITGQWARADQFINDFVDYAWKLQNPDGSMSTDWFEGRADRNDLDRKVQTTGHIVEWLIGVMPDEQLQDPRMVRAVGFLTNAMYRNRTKEWEIGPKGHALRSLALYHDRVYNSPPPWRAAAIARGAAGGHHHHSR